MPIVTQIAEKIALLNLKRDRWNARGQTAWLFTNDRVPSAYETLGDYSPTTVPGASGQPVVWPAPAYDLGDGDAQIVAAFCLFTPSAIVAGQTVYGYYCTDNTSGLLVFAERLPVPITGFGADLRPITLSPRYREADAA